jgi:hypothetical protein
VRGSVKEPVVHKVVDKEQQLIDAVIASFTNALESRKDLDPQVITSLTMIRDALRKGNKESNLKLLARFFPAWLAEQSR